jgi:hypothetical protein
MISAGRGYGATAVQEPERSPTLRALDRYGRGEFDAALADLQRGRRLRDVVRDLRREADKWIDADGPGGDHRLRTVAGVALELVAGRISATYADYGEVRPLIEWACERLRRRPVSEFERLYYLASIALLQGARDEELLIGIRDTHYWPVEFGLQARAKPQDRHLYHAVQRFPRDRRIALAIVTTRTEAQMIASSPLSPGAITQGERYLYEAEPPGARERIQQTIDDLGQLMDASDPGREAGLRRAILSFVSDRPLGVTEDLEAASRSGDAFVRYVAEVMLGVIADRSNRVDDARSHYARAVEAVPATTATVALAASTFRLGHREDAAALIARWSRAPRPADPWRLYSQRDYRFFTQYRARIRAIIAS